MPVLSDHLTGKVSPRIDHDGINTLSRPGYTLICQAIDDDDNKI